MCEYFGSEETRMVGVEFKINELFNGLVMAHQLPKDSVCTPGLGNLGTPKFWRPAPGMKDNRVSRNGELEMMKTPESPGGGGFLKILIEVLLTLPKESKFKPFLSILPWIERCETNSALKKLWKCIEIRSIIINSERAKPPKQNWQWIPHIPFNTETVSET